MLKNEKKRRDNHVSPEIGGTGNQQVMIKNATDTTEELAAARPIDSSGYQREQMGQI